MYILKGRNRGFTLAEVMIALALSSIMLIGLYLIIMSTLSTKTKLDRVNNGLLLRQKLQIIISQDIRSSGMANAYIEDTEEKEIILSVKSANSLYFNKSVIVNIYYYIKKNVLYREESIPEMGYKITMPLMRNVDSYKIESYNGNSYIEGFNPKFHIYRFSFSSGESHISFITGRAAAL